MNLTLLYPKYTELRKANPEFARRTVRKIIRRFKEHREEGLKDLPRRPKRSPNKTPPHLELAILSVRKKTGYGRVRIARVLKEKGIEVKPSTVRYVLKRYGLQGRYKRSKYRKTEIL